MLEVGAKCDSIAAALVEAREESQAWQDKCAGLVSELAASEELCGKHSAEQATVEVRGKGNCFPPEHTFFVSVPNVV